jgi:hypothetical protein
LKELPVLGTFLRKQNQRIGHFWVFEKNPSQRIACFRYFKNPKEPLGFMKEQLVGCWFKCFAKSSQGWVWQIVTFTSYMPIYLF